MEQAEQENLFEAKVNDTGRMYIRKFASIIKPVLLLGIIISLLRLAEEYIHAIKADPAIYRYNSLLSFENSLLPYYMTVHTIVFFFQVYFYWKTSRLLLRGINEDSEADLNNAFKALFQNAFYGLISLILSLGISILDFYLTVQRHLL